MLQSELPSSPPADCNPPGSSEPRAQLPCSPAAPSTSGSSPFNTRDKLVRLFSVSNVPFSQAGLRFLSKIDEGFLDLWKEFEPKHNRPLQVLKRHAAGPICQENVTWMSPEAGDLGIAEVKSLLTWFDNPEEVTKEDVHVWVNLDEDFRPLFQSWCKSEDCGGDEAILFKHFKAFLNRKKLPKKLNEMLKETWPPGEKVNEKNLAIRLESSEQFRKAWGYLKDLRGNDAKTVLRNVVKK